ncbi:MAG: hypothetical protein M3019_02275 [Candidatus Dormibacteraeota bacterium]|nr:hypothetical protein [Candidatus Dormibacteraeota bacterium]
MVVTGDTLKLGPAELSSVPPAQYQITVGTRVDVELPDEQAPFCWSIPTLSVPSVLTVEEEGDDPGGGAHARFRAVTPGTVTVRTTSECYTYPPCGAAFALTEAVLIVRQ